MMEKLKAAVRRLKEPSTWAGLSVLGLLLGLNPVTMDALQQAGVGIAALLSIVLTESGGGA